MYQAGDVVDLERAALRRLFRRDFAAKRPEKSRLRRPSLPGRVRERVVNFCGSSSERARDFWPSFAQGGRFLPHPERDGFGTETFGRRCECGKPYGKRQETKKAERATLGLVALTPWWTGLQAKSKSSPRTTLFVTMRVGLSLFSSNCYRALPIPNLFRCSKKREAA